MVRFSQSVFNIQLAREMQQGEIQSTLLVFKLAKKLSVDTARQAPLVAVSATLYFILLDPDKPISNKRYLSSTFAFEVSAFMRLSSYPNC